MCDVGMFLGVMCMRVMGTNGWMCMDVYED